MSIWRLIQREILHRKLNFALALCAVIAAVAASVGAVTLLAAHRVEVTQQTVALNDEMRKITKRMGFNVMILPKDQDLGDLYSKGFASKTMPEGYADTLANSKIVTVNHLLPSLEQKLSWPERDHRTIVLVGVKGQVPISHRDPRKPIMQAVKKGKIILGAELARTEKLKVGDKVGLLGKEFEVEKVNKPLGNKKDITVWIDLETAQKMLKMEGKINAIFALECACAMSDLPKVRAEITKILPGTQVVEFGTKALARAEARQAAVKSAEATLSTRTTMAAIMLPAVILGMGVIVWVLTLGNVRERRYEIGVLRALGLSSNKVVWIFVAKALVIGLVGGLIGWVVGYAATGWYSAGAFKDVKIEMLFLPLVLAAVIVLTPVLTVVASWLPAISAAGEDPALVLREE